MFQNLFEKKRFQNIFLKIFKIKNLIDVKTPWKVLIVDLHVNTSTWKGGHSQGMISGSILNELNLEKNYG